MQHLSGLKDKWLAAIAGAGALDQLENLRVEALGKKAFGLSTVYALSGRRSARMPASR